MLAGPGVGASRRKETIAMPKDSRALTRAARARMAFGETYTQARAGLLTPPRMNRDMPPDGLVAALMFGELMAAGRRAAITAPVGLAAAAAAVQTAITPLWPQVVPEAARDVLVACAQLAVNRGITARRHAPAGRRAGARRAGSHRGGPRRRRHLVSDLGRARHP